MIPLIAVAHGSRDPRSARAVAAALAVLRTEHPEWDVRLAFLDLNTPSVPQVLDAVAADGYRRAVVVPLLLGSAFHARVDLPAILADARTRTPPLEVMRADILGDDALLVAAARDSIASTGVALDDPSVGVAFCAVGSRRDEANTATARVVPRVTDGTTWAAVPCYATAAEPTAASALGLLARSGCRTLVVAPWMLAPGLLWDRACAAAVEAHPGVRIAPTLTTHAAVGHVVAERYLAAVRRATVRAAA
ncbi:MULTISPECIES: sirohydrochlorin chelatase [unclassified Rhodococcus (in: high G+C Gram-positive bacteria)]|uniref:sirohydrochlorin chelatase n=1 Tax=unclassified Rhodococcus (in: high G+C Gram-positive bacteria) TaxID=192944 RepID=UPI00146C7283|nr:sirohydrochlorin chelatase [Rhodococcus sp. 105337]NME78599.1 sirohydrochlorin chelatase [Rhodococcus sp. 105337]